jgi:hypothetical protein
LPLAGIIPSFSPMAASRALLFYLAFAFLFSSLPGCWKGRPLAPFHSLCLPVFYAVLAFQSVGPAGAAYPMLASCLLLPILGASPERCFALLLQVAGLVCSQLFLFPAFSAAYAVGLLGSAEFFPFCFSDRTLTSEKDTVLLRALCHSSYLLTLLFSMAPAVNFHTLLLLAALTALSRALLIYGECAFWRCCESVAHFAMAVFFGAFMLLPGQRMAAVLAFFSLALSVRLLAVSLPVRGPLAERELKGLFQKNAPRATIAAAAWLLLCFSPAIPLLLRLLPALGVLKLTAVAVPVCLCAVILPIAAIRFSAAIAQASPCSLRHGPLLKRLSPFAIFLCGTQLAVIFAIFLASAGAISFKFHP